MYGFNYKLVPLRLCIVEDVFFYVFFLCFPTVLTFPSFPSFSDSMVSTDFEIPTFQSLGISESDSPVVYFCGNSLGLLPKGTRQAIKDELDAWAQRGVESHFNHPNKTDWVDIDLPLVAPLAELVGALEKEVAAMGSLTSNLNALMVSFYRPQGRRTKILFERHAFPSDYYAFLNMVKLHGYDESHLVQIDVPEGATYIDTNLVLEHIDRLHEELAVVCLPGIQYYTGQLFDIASITARARHYGIVVGWDLAHAVGNVPLDLHRWDVDFAAWCSYKYLNAGPGGIAGIFVHERHTRNNSAASFPPRLAGWWGNNPQEKFKMLELFDPVASALSYRQSNPSVLDCVALKASLDVFQKAGGVKTLRQKSLALTGSLQKLLQLSPYYIDQNDPDYNKLGFRILTPLDPEQRGAQLSILFQPHKPEKLENVMEIVNSYLHNHGIIADERRPDVIRLAPVPLYNTMDDVEYVVRILSEAMKTIETK